MPSSPTRRNASALNASIGGGGNGVIGWVALLVLVVVIVLYFGLIPLGQWQADEYDDFARLAQRGWLAGWERLQWSPRPLSELVFLGYGSLVNYLRQPLIAPFLALLWCGLLASAVLTAWQTWRRNPRDGFFDLFAGLGLVAAFLASSPIFEVFYWPAGAVAYLPTLSATLLLFLYLARGEPNRALERWVTVTCLTIAALSSEMGATFVVCFGITAGAVGWFQLARTNKHYETARSTVIWLSIPVVLAIAVLVAVRLNRYHAVEESVRVASSALDHPVASTLAAGRHLGVELLGCTPHRFRWTRLVPGLTSEAFVAAAVALCLVRGRGKQAEGARLWVAVVSTSLLLACFLTLAASYLHFGAATGARHETIRRCWILMSLAGIAFVGLASPKARPLRRRATSSRPGAILMVAGVLIVWHVTPLLREYSVYRDTAGVIAGNFRSGFQKSSRQMDWINPPNRGVLTPATISPGAYSKAEWSSDYARYVLTYFDKDVLVVHP